MALNFINISKDYFLQKLKARWSQRTWAFFVAAAVILGFIVDLNSTKSLVGCSTGSNPKSQTIDDSPLQEHKIQQKEKKALPSVYFIKDQLLVDYDRIKILDGNLYIGQHFASFMFGGVNLSIIKVAGRKKNGSPAEIFKRDYIANQSFLSDNDTIICLNSVFSMEIIEFQYKSKFYLIEFESKWSNECSNKYKTCPQFSIKEIEKPNMLLIGYQEINQKSD